MTLPLSVTQSPHKIVLYQAVNLINGKRYIGITGTGFGRRVMRHFRTARLHQKGAVIGAAIRKYKQRNIKFSVLVVCPDYEYAKQLEVAAIAAFKPEYNLTKGGDGASGYKHTDEHKKHMSALYKERYGGSPLPWQIKKHTPEAIEKMRESARKARAEGRGGFQPGHTLTRHKYRTPQVVRSVKSKVATSTITGESFPSVSEAARSLKCQRSYIRNSGNFIIGWVVAPAL